MPISVRLSPDIETRLDRLSNQTGRPKAYYIKEAIGAMIDRQEYEYGILRDLEDYRAGRMKTYTHEEVGEMLGLD